MATTESHAIKVAGLVRRFRFVPDIVPEKDQSKYGTAICITPLRSYHIGIYEGLYYGLSFTPRGAPFILGNQRTKVEGLYLNSECFSMVEVIDISNGLVENNWNGGSSDVLTKVYNGSKDRMCYGMFAAGLGTYNIFMSALLSLIVEYGTFEDIQRNEEYPFLSILLLGCIVRPGEYYRSAIYRLASIPECMETVSSTVLKIREDRPELLDKWVKFIANGIRLGKLQMSELTKRITSV